MAYSAYGTIGRFIYNITSKAVNDDFMGAYVEESLGIWQSYLHG